MQSVKVQTSKSYQEYLIASLKDPEEAAGYITAILEEEAPEPELLCSALEDVVTALGESKDLGLPRAFKGERSQAIYDLTTYLDKLGLKLSVTVK
ncbi:putative transcriptional regulator [Synechococcus sp. PCC 7502]|uniref:hypothetical protein n=1 Tax=Synechococcus sp. PCC 7502 TaxID=1173263 RepID=UPI00029FEB83|nr:hypothetical protein [Synechococcus sp. PCC 7502]AFY75104.1 putative transcriptional regulator [Synechococcus sp. PCC 7502]